MAEAVAFHFRDRDTFLNHANPMAKLIALLALSIILVNAPLPTTLLITVFLVFLGIVVRIPILPYLRESLFFLFMAAFIGVTEYIASHSWAPTIAASLRFLDIVFAGMLLADTTAPDDLSRSLGAFLDVIPFVNGPAVASTIELTLSVIPTIYDISMDLRIARTSRGLRMSRSPVRALVSYTNSMFNALLDRMDELSVALDARMFDPSVRRATLPFSYRDGIILGVTAVIVAVSLLLPYVLEV